MIIHKSIKCADSISMLKDKVKNKNRGKERVKKVVYYSMFKKVNLISLFFFDIFISLFFVYECDLVEACT
jgi:hypothetical protein